MTAEKTSSPTVTRHQQAGNTFFRKATEEGFFGPQQATPFFGHAIQPKLSVSQPDDPQEKEADAVADQVMRMPDLPAAAAAVQPQDETAGGAIMRLPNAAETPAIAPEDEEQQRIDRKEKDRSAVQPLLMRKCAECEKEEQVQTKLMRSPDESAEDISPADFIESRPSDTRLHPKAHGPPATNMIQCSGRAPPAPDHSFEETLQSSKGEGSPLSNDTRRSLETRFGADFSDVRIHTGTRAESLSAGIHAQAFTHGGDIYFNSGKYSPDTTEGGRLLAHELTHTIQQGASRPFGHAAQQANGAVTPKLLRSIPGGNAQSASLQRTASSRPVPSQLTDAVAKAKAEEGKVNANKEGPDGFRTGHDRLIEYFKTTLGEDKVVAAGGPAVQGAVAEQDIKKKREITGALVPAHPAIERKGPYKRDAMPSWCGIFVFWALHKAGVPMKPWGLGGRNVTPDAAYPPGYTPQAGDIAYRNDYSHFAIVEKASGDTITTVNGNTAGEDNLGGQVQTRDHPRSGWTAFFDPLMLKDGPLSSGETTAEEVRPLSIAELRKKLFNVDRKSDEPGAGSGQLAAEQEIDSGNGEAGTDTPDTAIQTKPELSNWSISPSGGLQRTATAGDESLQAKDDGKMEEEKTGRQLEPSIHKKGVENEWAQSAAAGPISSNPIQLHPTSSNGIQDASAPTLRHSGTPATSASRGPPSVQLKAAATIQRSWLGDAWDAVGDAVNGAVEWAEDQLNEAKEWILEQIRDFVVNIPGYRILTLILEEDPITGARVARTGENMLEAGLDILPLGDLFRQVLIRTGTYGEAASFVLGRVDDFVAMASGISSRFSRFVDSLSVTDIGDPQSVLNSVASLLHDVISSIVGFITRSAEDFLAMIKRIMINAVVGFVRSRIPRLWPLLTVALGHDPITNEEVPRNGTNILNALFEVTDEGREQRRQLQETGTFQRVADWIDRGIAVFTRLYTAIRTGFTAIWDIISIESLFSPLETFERIYDHFATPVIDVWNFVRDTAAIIIAFIKEALLSRLSAWAREQRGYFLITLLIRRDPFTNSPVPFTVENVIHAFMSLMEGGEAQFQQMKESGAIDRTTNRITAAVRRLNFTVEYIVGLFSGLWSTLRLSDLANPFALFRRVINTFAQPVRRLAAFVVEIVRIVVEVLLQMMQFPTDLIANIISRAMAAWESIKRDPIGFLKNLLRAIKQGFIQFFDHIIDHLLFGLTGWLMSELRDAGVPALTDFSLRGVISWVLQVLNISMDAIWAKLAAHPRIGPARVARIRGLIGRLEGIWTFIRDVQERGITAIWERIQEQLSNLWETILDAVKNWIMEQIISRIVTRLLSMLDPTGIMAVINSAIALYRAIQSFIRYLRQILEVINSFVTGLADIAAGNISTAANYLEQTMRRAMPIVIGFLANQVGLSGIGHRIGEMVGRARELVDQALTWLVNRAVNAGFALFDRLTGAGGTPAPGATAPQPVHNFPDANEAVPFYMGEESHELRLTSRGGVIEITMSSNERIILPMYLAQALHQVSEMPNFTGKSRIRQRLEHALRQVDENGVRRLIEDWNTSNVGGTRARSQPEFIRERLLRVIEDLSDLAVGDKKIPAIVGLYDLLNKNTRMPGPYAGMADPLNVVPFGEFSGSQKRAILNANASRNSGVIKSDCDPAQTLHDGDPNDSLKANVDHIYPRAKGGSNSYSNAQVISRISNLRKSDTMEGCP